MGLYDDANELYYELRQLGYSVPIEFQAIFRELEEWETGTPFMNKIEQDYKQQTLPKGRYIKRIDEVEQAKLPTIDDLASLYTSKVKPIPKEPKHTLHKVSNLYSKNVPKEIPEQKPLRKFRADPLTKVYNARYQQGNLNLPLFEQGKHKPIIDDSVYKPLVRTKRKSWGGRSRTYKLNVIALRKSILHSYKPLKLDHYEIQGQDLNKLTATLRRKISHIRVRADIKESVTTPKAIYNMAFTEHYMLLVKNVFQQDIYDPMTKAQKRAFNNSWKQGHISTGVIMDYMLAKLSEYGGGDIRTSDPKAITRIVQGNNLAVRRCLANLKEIVASGWEEYEQENKKELDTRSTTQGAFLTSEKQAEIYSEDIVHMNDIQARK